MTRLPRVSFFVPETEIFRFWGSVAGVHEPDLDDAPVDFDEDPETFAAFVDGYCSVADPLADLEPDSDDVDDCLEPDDWWYCGEEYDVGGAFRQVIALVARRGDSAGSWALSQAALEYVGRVLGHRLSAEPFPTTREFLSLCFCYGRPPHDVLEQAARLVIDSSPKEWTHAAVRGGRVVAVTYWDEPGWPPSGAAWVRRAEASPAVSAAAGRWVERSMRGEYGHENVVS